MSTSTTPITTPEQGTPDLTSAVRSYLRVESKAWRELVDATVELARADAASDLGDTAKAKLAAGVSLSERQMAGHRVFRTISTSTYSKRVKVGRFANETAPDEIVAKLGQDWADANAASESKLTWRDAFDLACDDPSLDKFYNFLPKAEHLAKAKGTGRRAAKAEVSAPETAEVTPAVFADSDAPKAAADFLAGLRTRGASQLQISSVIDELIRLTTPVRSVKAVA